MRKFFLGFAVLGFAAMSQGSASAETFKYDPTFNLNRYRPDLEPVFVGKAGDILVIEVINRGLDLNNQPTVARVRMYQTVNGKEFYVTGTYASIPLVPSGQLRRATVRFPQPVANCRIQVEIDFNNQVREANENNNVKSWMFK